MPGFALQMLAWWWPHGLRGSETNESMNPEMGELPTETAGGAQAETKASTAHEPSYSSLSDPRLAVAPFDLRQRLRAPAALLDRDANAAACRWNQHNHPAVSGVAPEHIRADLARYVSFPQIQRLIRAYNRSHPSARIDPGTGPVDAIFVEAVHQFQAKVFLERSQVDGLAGGATLVCLGITEHRATRLNPVRLPNSDAQARLRKVDVRDYTRGEFTAGDWFDGMVNLSFCGWTARAGVHLVLARRLRAAERWLLTLPRFREMTPVEMGRALGFDERREEHKGARPGSITRSMHTYGLALDILYSGNPWVGGVPFTRALKHASLLVSGEEIRHPTVRAYFASLGTDPRISTAEIHAVLSRRNEDFRAYLRLHDDASPLLRLLELRRASGTPGVFAAPDEETDAAVKRWKHLVGRDAREMWARASPFQMKGSGIRDPLEGFLNLPEELVVALRDHACLAWGAVDLGPGASGDMMHFDARVGGIGALLAAVGGNARVTRGHPCLASGAHTG